MVETMARRDRKALADLRAMEEEGERLNPVSGRKDLGHGYASMPRTTLVASGATPSMGLSQFRGGGDLEITHHDDSDSDEEHAMEAGKLLGKHISGLHGAGYLKKFHAGMMCGGVDTGAYEGSAAPGVSGGAPGLSGGAHVVGGKKTRAPSAARKARGAMVSKLMREKGMTLGEASKYIKEHGMK